MNCVGGVENPRVLVLDDNPLNLMLLEEILSKAGYEVRSFTSGMEAIPAAIEWKPDLILLDVIMPEMNGYEVCQNLKADEKLKEIPVIFCSALVDAVEKVSAFSEGGVDYVTKPFDADEVLARVGTHLKIAFLQRCLSLHNENLEAMVSYRTKELAEANKRLLENDRLKNEFLLMISHEILTPVNGVLGIGEMMLDEVSNLSSDGRWVMYRESFGQSLERLRNLIDDAGVIARIEKMTIQLGEGISLSWLVEEMRTQHPEIRFEASLPPNAERVFLKADPSLLLKAMKTAVGLAECFTSGDVVSFTCHIEGQEAGIVFPLDKLFLSPARAVEFFSLESSSRASSHAERLGLAPVVAKKILSILGGDMRLSCAGERTGELVVTVPVFLPSPSEKSHDVHRNAK